MNDMSRQRRATLACQLVLFILHTMIVSVKLFDFFKGREYLF